MIAGACQVHERSLDLFQLHMPAGLNHTSRGRQGPAPPHPSATAQPCLSPASPADHQPQGPARPASAAHPETVLSQDGTGQILLPPQALESNAPPQQHSSNAAGPSALPTDAADGIAPDAACPHVQFGVFTNLASGGVFMGPSKMSVAAHQAMSSFASDDLAAAPAIQKSAGRPSGSRQQATCFTRPGTRAVNGTMGMQGTGSEQALKDPYHAHQHPMSDRQHQSAAQPASCMPAADPTEAVNPAAVMKAAAAAVAAADRPFTNTAADAADTAGALVTEPAGSAVMRVAAAKVCGNSEAAGRCPSVQFGVFTNLRSGGMWAPPGKLSEKAKKRAIEVFPDGALEVPVAAAAPAAPAFACQAQPALQQPAVLQPAGAARSGACSTGQLCSGMLGLSSCEGVTSSDVLFNYHKLCIHSLSFSKCTNSSIHNHVQQ